LQNRIEGRNEIISELKVAAATNKKTIESCNNDLQRSNDNNIAMIDMLDPKKAIEGGTSVPQIPYLPLKEIEQRKYIAEEVSQERIKEIENKYTIYVDTKKNN
jgi:hypothetical protein